MCRVTVKEARGSFSSQEAALEVGGEVGPRERFMLSRYVGMYVLYTTGIRLIQCKAANWSGYLVSLILVAF